MKDSNRHLIIDDALFVMALAIPALVAASCYVESDREMAALRKPQEVRSIAIAKVATEEQPRTSEGPFGRRTQSGAAQTQRRTAWRTLRRLSRAGQANRWLFR
jgi:hypothetical protein